MRAIKRFKCEPGSLIPHSEGELIGVRSLYELIDSLDKATPFTEEQKAVMLQAGLPVQDDNRKKL